MIRNGFKMKSIICMLLFFIITGFSSLYGITQQDINKLVSFAESILDIAKSKGIKTDGISFEDYYLQVIEKAYLDIESLFKKKNWNFDEMDELIYKIGLIMSLKSMLSEDYIFELLAAEGITRETIDLVLKNEKKLLQFFIYPDIENLPEDVDDYSSDDYNSDDYNSDDVDFSDTDVPMDESQDPDNDFPEDMPPPH